MDTNRIIHSEISEVIVCWSFSVKLGRDDSEKTSALKRELLKTHEFTGVTTEWSGEYPKKGDPGWVYVDCFAKMDYGYYMPSGLDEYITEIVEQCCANLSIELLNPIA